MDGKAKKRLEVIRQKLLLLKQRLAGAKKQDDEPGEIQKLEKEIAALEAEALEAEALRTSRLAAMGETAAMLAHEVRNPLGAMELFTGLLLDDLHDRPETRELALEVARGIADLNHLVTNLLEFTRTQTARVMPIDCRAVLEDALRYTADLRGASGVVVERRYAAPAVAAVADPNLLRPVLLNLMRNAVQAMPEGGTLTVGACTVGAETRLTVVDTGPGVPEAVREEICARDVQDTTRALAPLRRAPDAILIDTTGLTVARVVERMFEAVERRRCSTTS